MIARGVLITAPNALLLMCVLAAYPVAIAASDQASEQTSDRNIQRSYTQWYAMAAEAFQTGDFGRMRIAIDGALTLRPDFPDMLYYRAMANSKLGDADGAFADLEKLALMQTVPAIPDADAFSNVADDSRFNAIRYRLSRLSTQPQGNATLAYKLSTGEFLPEGIAYDDRNGALYLGSVRKAHILRIVPPGRIDQTLISPDLGAVFGMRIDKKNNRLWLATGVVPELDEAHRPENNNATLMVYNIGERVHLAGRYPFGGPGDDQSNDAGGGDQHLFGDLVIASSGHIITTDSIGSGVYRLDPDARQYQTLIEPGVLYSPQGLALADDGRLYVADYRRGLYLFDLERGSHQRYTTLDDASLYGIDGLYRQDNYLVAIQNGIKPNRVVQIPLNDDGAPSSPVQILAMNLEGMDEPTLGSLSGNRFFFVANSQWHRFADPKSPPKPEDLTGPRIMSVDLP